MKTPTPILLFVLWLSIIPQLAGQTVVPEVDGDIYSLKVGNLDFKIDAGSGAKVSSVEISGDEFLVTSDISPGFLWGSALWPAPQSEFGWPPPMALDDGEYSGSISDNIMSFESPIDVDGNDNELQFIKSFWADDTGNKISLQYSLVNKSSSEIKKALWELTRVPVNGLTFWPTGPGGTWGDLASFTVEQEGHTWIDISAVGQSGLKFFADGSDGWFAHVDEDRRIIIKKFDDVNQSDFADGEGELELWIDGVYIELENLSAAQTLQAGETLSYDVQWYIRQLPVNVSVEIGSASLISYVNGVLDGSELPSGITEEAFAQSHKFYPNPVINSAVFSVPVDYSTKIHLEVFDIIGKNYISTNIEDGQSLDLNNLQAGIYYYSLQYNGKTENGRIVKK